MVLGRIELLLSLYLTQSRITGHQFAVLGGGLAIVVTRSLCRRDGRLGSRFGRLDGRFGRLGGRFGHVPVSNGKVFNAVFLENFGLGGIDGLGGFGSIAATAHKGLPTVRQGLIIPILDGARSRISPLLLVRDTFGCFGFDGWHGVWGSRYGNGNGKGGNVGSLLKGVGDAQHETPTTLLLENREMSWWPARHPKYSNVV